MKILPKYNFTKLEKATIQELLQYSVGKKVEAARVLKNGKNITNKFILEETPTRIFLNSSNKDLMANSTYIHYHPKPLPLSFGDVLTAFNLKFKKIMAIFDDGRYSIFCPNPKSPPPTEELVTGNQIIRDIIQKNGEDFILKNPTEFEKYKTNMHNFWQNLSQRTNSRYFSNM